MVLDRGHIDDIGRHEELLQRCDIYNGLWHQQTSHVTAMSSLQDRAPIRNQASAT